MFDPYARNLHIPINRTMAQTTELIFFCNIQYLSALAYSETRCALFVLVISLCIYIHTTPLFYTNGVSSTRGARARALAHVVRSFHLWFQFSTCRLYFILYYGFIQQSKFLIPTSIDMYVFACTMSSRKSEKVKLEWRNIEHLSHCVDMSNARVLFSCVLILACAFVHLACICQYNVILY